MQPFVWICGVKYYLLWPYVESTYVWQTLTTLIPFSNPMSPQYASIHGLFYPDIGVQVPYWNVWVFFRALLSDGLEPFIKVIFIFTNIISEFFDDHEVVSFPFHKCFFLFVGKNLWDIWCIYGIFSLVIRIQQWFTCKLFFSVQTTSNMFYPSQWK